MPFRRVGTILVEVYLIFFKVHFGYKFKLSLGIYLLFGTMFAVSVNIFIGKFPVWIPLEPPVLKSLRPSDPYMCR